MVSGLKEVRNGAIFGTVVTFKVIQAGCVLVERVISGKTESPFTLS